MWHVLLCRTDIAVNVGATRKPQCFGRESFSHVIRKIRRHEGKIIWPGAKQSPILSRESFEKFQRQKCRKHMYDIYENMTCELHMLKVMLFEAHQGSSTWLALRSFRGLHLRRSATLRIVTLHGIHGEIHFEIHFITWSRFKSIQQRQLIRWVSFWMLELSKQLEDPQKWDRDSRREPEVIQQLW